jgi:anaerobic selenocysteine-containing dehydrogenase
MTEPSTPISPGGSSRRRFLAAAGTGAAAVGVGAAIGPIARADAQSASSATPPTPAAGVDGPFVAYVTDVASGEVTIIHGDREVVVHDHAIVAALTHRLSASEA